MRREVEFNNWAQQHHAGFHLLFIEIHCKYSNHFQWCETTVRERITFPAMVETPQAEQLL